MIKLLDSMKIGHTSLGKKSGVSVILAPEGCMGGVSVKGFAPGTHETDALKSENAVTSVDAIVLTGGSAFGLEACFGVKKFLLENGRGVKIGSAVVPIVAGAVIFDLDTVSEKEQVFPKIEDGYLACVKAKESRIEWGSVGVGVGATVGKVAGKENSMKGGIGAFTVQNGEFFVTAIMAVNAFGDVFCEKSSKILAGSRVNGNFIDTEKVLLSADAKIYDKSNTTIGCVITNANLTKVEANKLASIAHNGLARSIKPVHTDLDGDTIFALAKGENKANFIILQTMAVEAVRQAVIKAVEYAGD